MADSSNTSDSVTTTINIAALPGILFVLYAHKPGSTRIWLGLFSKCTVLGASFGLFHAATCITEQTRHVAKIAFHLGFQVTS